MRNLLKRGLPSSELNPRHPEEILITITLVTLNHGLESAIVDFTPESVYLQPGSLRIEHLGSFTHDIDLKIVQFKDKK
jgi:hypothetical protein